MGVSEFWNSTYRDVIHFIEARADARMAESKDRWSIMRRELFYLLNIQLEKKDKIKDERQLLQFMDEDKYEDVPVIDPFSDEMNEFINKNLAPPEEN